MCLKKVKASLIKILILSATITCATPSVNNAPTRQQLEACTCLQEIENANQYTGKMSYYMTLSKSLNCVMFKFCYSLNYNNRDTPSATNGQP